jgi:hypothetical protein
MGWLVGAVGIELKALLRPRKLLILRFGKVGIDPEIAEARYAPGTRRGACETTRTEVCQLV